MLDVYDQRQTNNLYTTFLLGGRLRIPGVLQLVSTSVFTNNIDSLAKPSLRGPGRGGTFCSEPNREVGTWLELRIKSGVFRAPKKETYQNILGEQVAREINEGFLTEMVQLN